MTALVFALLANLRRSLASGNSRDLATVILKGKKYFLTAGGKVHRKELITQTDDCAWTTSGKIVKLKNYSGFISTCTLVHCSSLNTNLSLMLRKFTEVISNRRVHSATFDSLHYLFTKLSKGTATFEKFEGKCLRVEALSTTACAHRSQIIRCLKIVYILQAISTVFGRG